jgi:hypothetical protein
MTSTKKLQLLLSSTLPFALSVLAQSTTPTITVEAAMAPNAYGSPSFYDWTQNGIYAVENGLSSYGAGPAQFNVSTSPLPFSDNIVTGFGSWLGQAPGPYLGEEGNRASFVAVINGNGSLIDIANMGFTMNSSDPGDGLGWGWGPGSYDYNFHNIGIIYDNTINTAGGVTIVDSPGNPDQLVNEIISIGSGNAYAAYTYAEAEYYDSIYGGGIAANGGDPDSTATPQQIIDYQLGFVPSDYDFTGTYTYGDASGSATFEFVPDVFGSWALLAGSFGALAGLRRRFGRT